MSDQPQSSQEQSALRAGLRVSTISICWTLVASTVAVVLGIKANSVVLIAFGFTGLLDAAGSIALVIHFRHALSKETISERHEKVALHVITTGLFVVGVLTALGSIDHLINHSTSRSAPLGIATSSASVVVLAVLSHRKRKVAPTIPSQALLADGWLTAAGCLLAVSTVTGTTLTAAFGWWWVDPIAALVVAIGAIAIAVSMRRTSGGPGLAVR